MTTHSASAVVFIIVETPLHCGTGQDIGKVDQPIQRERTTGYPMIQASELKGVFRDYYKRNNGKYTNEIFGPEESTDTGGEYASCVSFGDARILFFPVKSLKGVYAWITCKDVLDKFSRTLKLAGINNVKVPQIFDLQDEEVLVCNNSPIVINNNQSPIVINNNQVLLEEYLFNSNQMDNDTQQTITSLIDKIIPVSNNNEPYSYLNNSLKQKLCIVSNNVFKDFVEMSTEIITRIKINDETGVVETGALWTEEYLPADTILYFPLFVTDPKKKVNNLNAKEALNEIRNKINSYIQLGGNETVGKGFVKINWLPQEEHKNAT